MQCIWTYVCSALGRWLFALRKGLDIIILLVEIASQMSKCLTNTTQTGPWQSRKSCGSHAVTAHNGLAAACIPTERSGRELQPARDRHFSGQCQKMESIAASNGVLGWNCTSSERKHNLLDAGWTGAAGCCGGATLKAPWSADSPQSGRGSASVL